MKITMDEGHDIQVILKNFGDKLLELDVQCVDVFSLYPYTLVYLTTVCGELTRGISICSDLDEFEVDKGIKKACGLAVSALYRCVPDYPIAKVNGLEPSLGVYLRRSYTPALYKSIYFSSLYTRLLSDGIAAAINEDALEFEKAATTINTLQELLEPPLYLSVYH